MPTARRNLAFHEQIVPSDHQFESTFQLKLVFQASRAADRIIASVPDLADITGFRNAWLQINQLKLETLLPAFASPAWIKWIFTAIRLLKNDLYVNLPEGHPGRHLFEFSDFCISCLPMAGVSWLPVLVPLDRSFLVPERAVQLVLNEVVSPLDRIEWRSSDHKVLFRKPAGIPLPYSEYPCPVLYISVNSGREHLCIAGPGITLAEASSLTSRLDNLPLSAKSLLVRHFYAIRPGKDLRWTPGELSICNTDIAELKLLRMILRERAYQILVAHWIDPTLPELQDLISWYVDTRGAGLGWWPENPPDKKEVCQELMMPVNTARSALADDLRTFLPNDVPASPEREPQPAEEIPEAAQALLGMNFRFQKTFEKSGDPPDWGLLDRLGNLPIHDLHRLLRMIEYLPGSEVPNYLRAATHYVLGEYSKCLEDLKPYMQMRDVGQEYTILAAFCARQLRDSPAFERLLFEN
jgi:hypothetical protein